MNIKDKEKLTKHIERNQVMTEITMFGKTADVEAVPSDRLLDYIEELTSPVKVPAFVAEWIEEVRQRGCGLADALNCFASPIIPNEVEEWVEFNSSALGMHHDHQELLARAWLDGYEVEEEPLFYIRLTIPSSSVVGLYLGFNKDGIFDHSYGKPHVTWDWKCTFTEHEIKSIDERYWPFAVPVEKV
ncbi:DUF1642 domain-containing protein [Enterococcus gilvus]|uniref:DUF1642 domain-containing protein n=1 Tax=Enterococcus gilvus TaxID=160453 RepID=UPI001C8C1967|nr:DUF1642 domain-containing protein [Enterococcus gilvus]MBX8939229.1 DUF1642 domain-containing protein [Enterococcus gilvus]